MKLQLLNWALLIALLLIFQEAIVRAVFPLPEVTNFNRVNYAAFAREGASSFLAKRQPAMNASFRWNSTPDHATFVSHLNLSGFRDRQWNIAPPNGAERVMFVGDSLVEGFMATDDQTIARGYQAAAQHSEAMNCGIGGDGIPEYLALIHDAVPLFHPRRLIVILYANDLPVTDPLPEDKTFLPQRLSWWTPRLVQVFARAARHEPVPRRWHSPPVLFVPVVPDPLNPWSSPPPEFSRVDPAIAEAMRKGDFNPFVVDVLNKAATALREPIELSDTLRQLNAFARAHGTELRVVYLPFSTQVSDYYVPFQQKYATHHEVDSLRGPAFQIHQESLRRSCAELTIPFLDLTPLLRRAEEKGEHLYWDFDEHMLGPSYTRVGATIARWVASGSEPDRLE
ncbi:MAG: SGNH/GDSL hydrolase family protein [Chthoniobacterales bacterium]|nr:SGNH/GDSL hydrolase family protein [Chthoniobacterales bacterium]